MPLLGLNIDHVATVRNARGGPAPDPLRAALLAESAGADGITVHLREDRRHIRDADVAALKTAIQTRLNLEMANTPEMLAIALKVSPYMCTIVPERREELTTEGGLNVLNNVDALQGATTSLQAAGILVSLFIDPEPGQIQATHQTGARFVEFHTGRYCESFDRYGLDHPITRAELQKLLDSAALAVSLGIRVNAGHGLTFENVPPILAMAGLEELNIGHSLIAEAIFIGLPAVVQKMKALIA